MSLPDGIIRTPAGVHVLKDDTHLSRWIEEHGRLDIAEKEIAGFARYIPLGGVVIDAGACLGDHTATYAKLVGEIGMVWAIEPMPLTYQALALNFKGAPNVRTMNAALGCENGTEAMIADPNIGSSRMVPRGPKTIEVPTLTIDSLRLTRVDFIHLDCEGFEMCVLRGAVDTLRRCRPVIVLEINKAFLKANESSESLVVSLLESHHYRMHETEPLHGPHLGQRDILCLPYEFK